MMLTGTAHSALALDFKGVDVRPFVVVQETCLRGPDFDNPTIPLGKGKRDQTTAISQGGAVTANLAFQVQAFPYMGGSLQGIATPKELASFFAAASSARLGVQESCKLVLACTAGGQTVVSWFGRGNPRRNSFTIVDSDSPANELVASCPSEVRDFLISLRQLLLDVRGHANTEVAASDSSAEPR